MAKQLNVNLAFSADTSKAKAQINDLISTLQNIAKMPGQATQLFDDKQIKEASNAALELQQHLTQATNVNTGKLDLSKFATSLKSSGKDLQAYYNQLLAIGPAGQQAFLQIAQAIATADASVIRINKKLEEIGTTLKNTARWQISSSILHGFMGTLQSAYGYAQDLNKSLNDIRIVTGASASEMDEFAIKANKAARALSTTTTAYTDAALIFYQQGLSDEEVEKRTNVTIKMAQAAGEDATQVSSYMTAIWNNFDDGSKSLEYYGDVMAKLGAKTAASSAEIADALEKFAAIGDTVGLSYEYATAAVATVVDKTRQSADTVGTAFKTIFARLQGLQLGETLEDGVNLNKYSAALKTVGVEVLDLNGNMKDANTIIDELGATWNNLSSAQKTALAQTVAGTRQYTQLISLMENFDAFQGNVGAAKNAEGTLTEQQEIYAEGWQAASKRVQAAAQDIYDSLLNDDFFIDLLNGLEKVLDGVGGLIDGFGGLGGIMSTLGSVFLTMYAKKMPQALQNLKDNLLVITGQSDKLMKEVQDKTLAQFANMKSSSVLDDSFKIQVEGLEKVTLMQQRLVMSSKDLTAEEIETYKMRIKNVQAIYDEVVALNDKKKAAEAAAQVSGSKAAGAASKGVDKLYKDYMRSEERKTRLSQKYDEEAGRTNAEGESTARQDKLDALANQFTQADEQAAELDARISRVKQSISGLGEVKDLANEFKDLNIDLDGNDKLSEEQVNNLNQALSKTVNYYQELTKKSTGMKTVADQIQRQGKAWQENVKDVVKNEKEAENLKKTIKDYVKSLQTVAKEQGFKTQEKNLQKVEKQLDECEGSVEDLVELFNQLDISKTFTRGAAKVDKDIAVIEDRLNELGDEGVIDTNGLEDMTQKTKELAQSEIELGIARENAARQSNEEIKHQVKASEVMTQFGATVIGVHAAISTITNAISIMGDEEASAMEKVGAAIALVTGVTQGFTTVQALANTLMKAGIINEAMLTTGKLGNVTATIAETLAAWGLNAALAPLLVVTVAITAAIVALIAIVWLVVAAFKAWQASTPEAKLEAAKEEAGRLSEELDKARDASDALKQSIEGYDSAVAKMKTLTEGTTEWREALEEANAAARKMIDENEDLKGQYSYNAETGLIEFDDGALEAAQQKRLDKVNTVQSQKLLADNNVMQAERGVEAQKLVKENNISGWKLGLTGSLIQSDSDKKQTMALNILADQFIANGGNMTKALDSLDIVTLGVVKSMGIADTELEAFCQEIKNNSDAMHENNKQIIDTRLSSNKAYKNADNKEFLNEVMAGEMSDQADLLYELRYKDKGKMGLGTGISDSDAQKQYAELMGWDPDKVKDESGNKATYVNDEGEEVTISDEQVRKYLAQEEALKGMNSQVEKYAGKVEKLEEAEMKLARAYEAGVIDYEQYKKALGATGKMLGINQKEMDTYISKFTSESMQRAGREETLMKNAAENFGLSEDEAYSFVQNVAKDLTNEELDMAIELAASSQSLDDFARQFQHVTTNALLNSVNTTKSDVSNMLTAADENGKFSQADFDLLENNEHFAEWLEANQMTMNDIIYASYTEQYNMISQFYADVNALQRESLEQSKENYQKDAQEYQAVLDYKRAKEEGDAQAMAQIKNAWGDKLDFEAYMDMDISELETKLDEAQAKIEEITNQQYEISMSWDGIDQVEGSMDELSDITKLMSKEAKKVGDSYQLTAAQSREWMEMYPELFDTAKVTTDGLIELSNEEYAAFKEKEEKKRQDNINAQLQTYKDELAELEEKRENAQIQLDIFTSMKNGEINLEKASAADLTAVRDSLTQFYIDSGMDEVNANKKALEDMGLSQEEYNKLIADSSEQNSQNLTDGFKKGFSKVTEMLTTFVTRLKNVFSSIGEGIKAIFTGDWSSIGTHFTNAWNSTKDAFTGVVNDYKAIRNNTYGNFQINGQYTKYKTEAEYKEAQTKYLDEAEQKAKGELEQMDRLIANKKAQIVYLQALANQDIEDYGSTDPNDVDGSKNRVKEEDLIKLTERYHEITREIKQQETALDRLAKKKDRAFGSAVLGIIDDEIEALDILYQKQEELLKIQSLYLASDKDNVTNMFANAQFDDYGNISNYTELLTQATNTLNAAKLKLGGSENESDKQALEDAEALYERQVEILEQYEETLDAWNEQVDILKDVKNQIQDANFEKITYKVELNVEVNERELAEIDYYLNKISEDFYMMEEAATLLKGKMGNFNSELEATEIQYHELEEAYKKNEISQGQYIEGLKNSYDGIMNNLSALNDLDKEMLHYYEDTLSAASEETDYYISQMEHLTGVLDHYRNIVELVNGEYDYEAIGTILEGQAKTRENEMAVATAEYEMLLNEKEAIEKQMASVEVGSAAWDLYNEELQAITQATMEAEEEMLSKTEAWAESMKAIMENTFATAAYEMEMMMTQGLGFDALNNSLDKLSTFQEEYLTNTNEIFELEKMMRTAQQAADKTNNEAAKIKLKNYQNEIDTLKNDGLPLSQLELNIQKAKYDLLLAEIALEEAQNAKSTVRLQRDSEGNFGYVYTADTEAISSAEQDLADAQNNLYNIGLEGTNDYGQKLLELQNQLSDDLIALEEERAAGRFKTDEEYYAAKNDLITHYNNLFTAYSNQYTTALGVDNRIQEDAWINAYQNMIVKTENWKDYTKEYTQECEDAYDEWRENAVDNNELIQDVLDDTEDEVKEVTKASDNLKKKVVDEVIPAVESELIAVRNITSAYAKQRAEIKRTVSQYEKLITTIREAIAAQAALAGESSIGYNEKGQVTDYSWAMADYLANKGGAYGDAHWERLVSERNKKLETDEYSKYADGADDFEEMMEKYYKYKTQGVDNELTKYVEDVIANKQYWDQNKVENLIDEFATGGYTGAWGPEGRLAVVHEKELMLNQEDTVNFLQGIGLLREIAQMIDLEAMRNQLGALPYLPIANMQGAGGLLEQSVHIEANFPGVSDRYEIEEAFNNILNTATQYANRKI